MSRAVKVGMTAGLATALAVFSALILLSGFQKGTCPGKSCEPLPTQSHGCNGVGNPHCTPTPAAVTEVATLVPTSPPTPKVTLIGPTAQPTNTSAPTVTSVPPTDPPPTAVPPTDTPELGEPPVVQTVVVVTEAALVPQLVVTSEAVCSPVPVYSCDPCCPLDPSEQALNYAQATRTVQEGNEADSRSGLWSAIADFIRSRDILGLFGGN